MCLDLTVTSLLHPAAGFPSKRKKENRYPGGKLLITDHGEVGTGKNIISVPRVPTEHREQIVKFGTYSVSLPGSSFCFFVRADVSMMISSVTSSSNLRHSSISNHSRWQTNQRSLQKTTTAAKDRDSALPLCWVLKPLI